MEVQQRPNSEETARDCRQAVDRVLELRFSHWACKLLLALWLRGYDRRKQDLSPADAAAWIGAGKPDRVYDAISELTERGALGCDGRQRGRYIGVWIVDLQSAGEDPDGPRRQACNREAEPELPDNRGNSVDWDEFRNPPNAQTARPVETLPISRPEPGSREPGPGGVDSIGRPPTAFPILDPNPGIPDFGPNFGNNATTTSTSRLDLSNTSTSKKRSNSGVDVKRTFGAVEVRDTPNPGIPDFGANSGNGFHAAAASLLGRRSLRTVEGLLAEFPAAPTESDPNAPAHWAEAIATAIDEATNGGRGFGFDDFDDCVKSTQLKRQAGTLDGPAWVFCRGAFQRKYRQRRIPWPKFKPKPR